MKIFCVGMNYARHTTDELRARLPERPVIFLKPDTALLKDDKDFYLPDFSKQVEYETEVVFRVNKMGKCVDPRFATRYIDSVALGIDVTARDLQNQARAEGLPWDIAKGFDASAILSDFIPIDQIPDWDKGIEFSLNIDDKEVQRGNTRDMMFSLDRLVAYISQFYTLKTGDLIYSGTPAGVGALNIGNHLQGFMRVGSETRQMIDCYVR